MSAVESPLGAREAVLSAIRTALADVPEAETAEDVQVPRDYVVSHLAEAEEAVALFAERVADYRATVTRTTGAEAAAAIGRVLADRGIDTVVVPEGFPDEWLGESSASVLRDVPALTAVELDGAGGVITTAAAGIALTGTIVLDGGPGQGRRALSLVPDYHLCVIRSSQIAEDVPEAVRGLVPTRPTTLISGPSATSDIELDRVEGVHGPRTLDVVIVQE